jgi:hypothetical protein
MGASSLGRNKLPAKKRHEIARNSREAVQECSPRHKPWVKSGK